MVQDSARTAPAPGDPRRTLKSADLVAAVATRTLAVDLGTFPDADTAIYARISRDRSDRTSVERQLEIGIAYAQEHGLSFVVFADRKSAYRRDVTRKDYNALLEAIRARRIRRVVTYKLDRLYRQVEELMDVVKIADGGRVPITLIGVDDEDVFDLTTPRGCDQAIGRVLEAQRESRRTSERVRTQRRKAREQGIANPGMGAFGWRDRYQHDEVEAQALRDAYHSILHGTSLMAIVKRWTDAGLRGGRGGKWYITTVKRVLMNQRNAGRLTHSYESFDEKGHKRTVVEIVREDAFEPIVDPETFDTVQRELMRRAKPASHPRRRSVLTGIVRCARCGNQMRRTPTRDETVYRCWSSLTGQDRGCGLSIAAHHIEPFIEDALFTYIDSPGFAQRLATRKEIGTRRADLIAMQDRLIKRRDVLRKKMLAADYDDELFGYEQDVREIAEQLRSINAELALFQPVNPAARWFGNGAGLREAWKRPVDDGGLDLDEKRAIIKDVFGTIRVKPSRRMGNRFDLTRIDVGVDLGGNGSDGH